MTSFKYAVKDCLTLSWRGAKHLTRRLDTLVTAAVLPIVLLLLFAYLFGGAVQIALGDKAGYLNYVLPGILLSSIGYVATTTASSVSDDMEKGFVSRLRSMPIARSSFIFGHIFASLIRCSVACASVTALALLIGYRTQASFSSLALAALLLLAFAFAMASIAVVLGLLASGPDAASAYSMPLMFLSYFSGALVPIDTMPRALQIFCSNQPVNVVWKALSGLTLGGPYSIWGALAWCIGVAVISLAIGGALFARKNNS